MIEIIFVIGLIGLVILWVFEFTQIYRLKKERETWEGVVNSFIESFLELRGVINVNAGTLRSLQAIVDRQEKRAEILATVVDIHAHALRLEALSERLDYTTITDLPIGEIDDNTDEGGAEETD